MIQALTFLASYLIGAIPLGLIIARILSGVDIRRRGTGNIGAANVAEQAGRLPAALTALGVFLQGLLPPLLARHLGASDPTVVAAALGAVVGYGWPVFMNFRGGRALGVGTGAATAMAPWGFLVLVATYATGAILRQTSLGTISGFIFYTCFVFLTTEHIPLKAGALLLLILVASRRLEGVGKDIRESDSPPLRVFLLRLLFQRRP
ncbi:glycerol-3-phosphate acyltransferase [Rubrobacter calidifluminis]|uniref:glycerol-3-phosphate acyltransferase n=1 Tax=Rubrobacter calidifluminis TaxID=1392640 RepID=UPI0023620756|nr:glycerol-3-phosphate acyltransferase [Rubrobacter calidifluminis]